MRSTIEKNADWYIKIYGCRAGNRVDELIKSNEDRNISCAHLVFTKRVIKDKQTLGL